MLKDREFEIIGHSLGVNVYHAKLSKRKSDKKLPKEFYRNHFQADKGHHDFDMLIEMCENGLMFKRIQFDQQVFHVSDAGKMLFKHEFPTRVS